MKLGEHARKTPRRRGLSEKEDTRLRQIHIAQVLNQILNQKQIHPPMSLVLPVMGSVGRGGQRRDTKADAWKERSKDERGKGMVEEIDHLSAGLAICLVNDI